MAAISVLLTRRYRRRRRPNGTQCSCYLHSEQKPQFAFKRVLADNSFSQFKHLKLPDDTNALMENPGVEFGFDLDSIELKEMTDVYVWVETESQSKELPDNLSKERVFAVDTEQHILRSFLGFTSLIQMPTQNEDYLLDTITLHCVMGILRPVFADPIILVFARHVSCCQNHRNHFHTCLKLIVV